MAPKKFATHAIFMTPEKSQEFQLNVESSTAGSTRKRLRRRSSEDAIDKCISDNFKGWSHSQIDLVRAGPEKLTIRETLRKHKRLLKEKSPDAVPMGKLFYASLRDQWQDPMSPQKRLRPKDENQPLQAELELALADLHGPVKKFDRIISWCTESGPCNQLSLVVLYQHALRHLPNSSPAVAGFSMAVLKYVARHEFHRVYHEEFGLMRAHFDECLCASWMQAKTRGISEGVWLRGASQAAAVLLNLENLEKVLVHPAGERWASLEGEIAELCHSTLTGRKLVGAAWQALLNERVDVLVESTVAELFSVDLITQDILEANKGAFLKGCMAMNVDPHVVGVPRKEKLIYQGVTIQTHVSSSYDYYFLRRSAFVHCAGLDCGQLPVFLCENELVPKGREKSKVKVSGDILASQRTARDAASELVRNMGGATSQTIKQCLSQNYPLLLQIDPAWKVTASFWESVLGASSEARFREEVLSCLPQTGDDISVADCLARLDVLGKSKLMEFMGLGVAGVLHGVRGVVAALAAKLPPPNHYNDNVLMKEVLAKMALWLTHGEGEELERGSPAAQKKFADMKAKFTKDSKTVAMPDCQPLIMFRWLITIEQSKDVDSWVAAAVARDLSSAATAAVEQDKKKHTNGRSEVDARQMVLKCIQ